MLVSRFQLRALYGLAACTVAVTTASSYMRKLLEERIFEQDVCRQSIDMLQKDLKSVDVLGPPITFTRPNMRNTFNSMSNTDASIAIPVSGINTSGNLLISAAKKEDDREWMLKSLTLEVPTKKIIIKNC